MVSKDIAVVPREALPWSSQPRYIIIDKKSGEVLDDAQGYGFKTVRKAYAAWVWKQYNSSLKEEDQKPAVQSQDDQTSIPADQVP